MYTCFFYIIKFYIILVVSSAEIIFIFMKYFMLDLSKVKKHRA